MLYHVHVLIYVFNYINTTSILHIIFKYIFMNIKCVMCNNFSTGIFFCFVPKTTFITFFYFAFIDCVCVLVCMSVTAF